MTKLKNLLDAPQSKATRDEMISYVGDSQKRMDELLNFFFHEEWRYNQKASWPLGVIGETKPYLLIPHLPRLLENLRSKPKDAVIRNTVRTFQFLDIPEEFEGKVYDICMDYLIDLKQAIAIRVFAMNTLANIAEKHEALQEELLEVIKEYYDIGSAGYKSRAKKIIKRFES